LVNVEPEAPTHHSQPCKDKHEPHVWPEGKLPEEHPLDLLEVVAEMVCVPPPPVVAETLVAEFPFPVVAELPPEVVAILPAVVTVTEPAPDV